MSKRARLSAEEISAQLPDGWTGDTASIEREYKFGTYLQGLDFAVQVAQAAEKADHHPDLLLGYRRVKVTFSTHDAGGVTALDLAGARDANELFSS